MSTRRSGGPIGPGAPMAAATSAAGTAGRSKRSATRASSHQTTGSAAAAIGTPNIIHCRNEISTPNVFCRMPIATGLTGVPIGVAKPPMLEPNATASTIAAANRRVSTSASGPPRTRVTAASTAPAIGSIMTVVAELLTHIETNDVTASIANSRRDGFGLVRDSTASATRRCRSHFSNAAPISAPPSTRNSTGVMYCEATASGFATPSSGNSRNGRLPVSVTGTASVNHHTAISSATAAVRQPARLSPSGGDNSSITRHRPLPSQKPIRCTWRGSSQWSLKPRQVRQMIMPTISRDGLRRPRAR